MLGSRGSPIAYTVSAFGACSCIAIGLFASVVSTSVRDPGPRSGVAAAGGPIGDISAYEKKFYLAGRSSFEDDVSVTGSLPETEKGLGPRFNLDSCSGCHAFPAMGGSSPYVNPEVEVATKEGARNRIPWFVRPDGPVRVARFRLRQDGSPDGSVHALFTISGRSDVPQDTCNIRQPDFDAEKNNVAFRIPTPLFGLGLVEALPDREILQNLSAHSDERRRFNIFGRVSRSANDGTINRFGWKAQNRSLLLFVGESYNVEMGVTNELFPAERDETPGCTPEANPQDHANYASTVRDLTSPDIFQLASFVRFLAPPLPAPETPATLNGSKLFAEVGCAVCHRPTATTGFSASRALSHKSIFPYSDFLLHHMGARLEDEITQGDAGPDEFRTAPLWGLGQRIFFLHDARTQDLLDAIKWHADATVGSSRSRISKRNPPSEANKVIDKFLSLSPSDQRDMLQFLRSL